MARQDSSATLHEAMNPAGQDGSKECIEVKSEKVSRPALSRDDTGRTRAESADAPACRCGALQARSADDIAESGNGCTRHCTDAAQASEKLQVTDEERGKAPPFCEMQKVLSGKGEQLIYVGWNGAEDPANPRNWSLKRKWIITAVSVLGHKCC